MPILKKLLTTTKRLKLRSTMSSGLRFRSSKVRHEKRLRDLAKFVNIRFLRQIQRRNALIRKSPSVTSQLRFVSQGAKHPR